MSCQDTLPNREMLRHEQWGKWPKSVAGFRVGKAWPADVIQAPKQSQTEKKATRPKLPKKKKEMKKRKRKEEEEEKEKRKEERRTTESHMTLPKPSFCSRCETVPRRRDAFHWPGIAQGLGQAFASTGCSLTFRRRLDGVCLQSMQGISLFVLSPGVTGVVLAGGAYIRQET